MGFQDTPFPPMLIGQLNEILHNPGKPVRILIHQAMACPFELNQPGDVYPLSQNKSIIRWYYDIFYRADANGFFVGILEGKPVACISAVAHGDSFGFLGFYIVLSPSRGRGLGTDIRNAGMEYLDGRNIGLDSVLHSL